MLLTELSNRADQMQFPHVAGEAHLRRAERLLAGGHKQQPIEDTLAQATDAYPLAQQPSGLFTVSASEPS